MKKKLLILALILSVVCLAGFMLYQTNQKLKQKKAIQANIQTLPNFTFYTLDSTQYTKANITENQAILVIYFNSECEHCQYEATEIQKQQAKFINTQILMVSSEELNKLKVFTDKYQLDKIPFLKVLKAESKAFYDTFGANGVPSIFIYNTKHQLVKFFKGEVKIEALLKYLK